MKKIELTVNPSNDRQAYRVHEEEGASYVDSSFATICDAETYYRLRLARIEVGFGLASDIKGRTIMLARHVDRR